MRRWIEKHLVTQISRQLIAQSLAPHSVLEIGVAGGNFTFTSKPKEQTQAAPTKKAKMETK